MMRYIFAILTAYLAVVSCQNRPPQPMETDSQGGVSVSSSLSTLSESSSSSQSTSSRPKGCSPGCGPTEICAELGASYCTGDRVCSVCIKMSSIRFPASALAGLFGQQQKQSEQQFNVPAQQLPSVDPFNQGMQEPQVSILELATRQQRIQEKLSKDFGGSLAGRTFIPRPPPVGENFKDPLMNPVIESTTIPTVKTNPFGNMATNVKYPIVATVHEPDRQIHEAQLTLEQSHLDRMHQQYTSGNVPSTLTQKEQKAAEFDYKSFKRYQGWLERQNVPPNQTPEEEFALFQKYREWMKSSSNKDSKITTNADTSVQGVLLPDPSPTSVPDEASSSTLPPFNYAAFKAQYEQGLVPLPGANGFIPPTSQPATTKETNYLDYATIQRLWQEQQQQQQQQQLSQMTTQQHGYYNVPQNNMLDSYAPQSANTYNDPFDIFGFNTFNDPLAPQQNQLQSNNIPNNNNMFNFMMFEGFGGGLGF